MAFIPPMARRRALAALLCLVGMMSAWAAPLNDTGITFCGGATSGNNSPCLTTDPEGQDADYGRDAAAVAGALVKIGGGEAGFDYTKIANNGTELPASAALGNGPTDWACTRDNVTGLIWEVKTDDGGLRDKDWNYTWYNSDPATNGGAVGSAGGNSCGGTLAGYGHQCNTEHYVAAVIGLGLCGQQDWRMPTVDELLSIVHWGRTYPVTREQMAAFPARAFLACVSYQTPGVVVGLGVPIPLATQFCRGVFAAQHDTKLMPLC
jgi:hypothetical protein